jgi:hypothetical protein
MTRWIPFVIFVAAVALLALLHHDRPAKIQDRIEPVEMNP